MSLVMAVAPSHTVEEVVAFALEFERKAAAEALHIAVDLVPSFAMVVAALASEAAFRQRKD